MTVHDSGEEQGLTYIVTELVAGGTLAERLGKPLPVDEAVAILGPIASALDYAHVRGVLHRDVKPSNILLQPDGTPVLSDFSTAYILWGDSRLTGPSRIVGTPAYMAPEQAAGEVPGTATDIYALAVVVYEMLTGSVPYAGGRARWPC